MTATNVITLLSDFGTLDPYVGVMKGVILRLNPSAVIVDITHEVPPQNVRSAGYVLLSSFGYFPPGSVHVAVVDPGVGTGRKAMVLEAAGHLFVAPDNGLLTELMQVDDRWRAVEITNPILRLRPVSSTFHGRDIFAPAAAHLAARFPVDDVGSPIPRPRTVERLAPRTEPHRLTGEVIWIDRFGNLVSTIRERDMEQLAPRTAWATVQIEVAGTLVTGDAKTYDEGGGLMALIGSSGRLEVSVAGGNARDRLRVRVGDPVVVSSRRLARISHQVS